MDYCKDVMDGSRVCVFPQSIFWKRRLDHGTACVFIGLFTCMHIGTCYEGLISAAQDIISVLCWTEGFCDPHKVTAWAKKLRKVQPCSQSTFLCVGTDFLDSNTTCVQIHSTSSLLSDSPNKVFSSKSFCF